MKIKIQNLKSDKWRVTGDKQKNFTSPETHHSSLITRHSAFTLVEMLLVVAIIGILAALVIPKIAGKSESARITAAQTDIRAGIKSALDQFEIDNGYYPKSLNDLLQQPNNAKAWHGPYFDPPQLPVDPWGNPYQYAFPGKHNSATYDLWSAGPPDGKNPIGNWPTTTQ
jgi:general secretion pathway protein G